MIALPVQEKFKLNDPKLNRALVDLQAAANLAGEDNDESDILDDLTRGPLDPYRIDWAWDIAGKNAEKREVRVLALCVQNRSARFSFDDVLYTIFPEQSTKLFRKPTLNTRRLANRLGCTKTHVNNLIDDFLLDIVPGSRGVGRNGSAAILWTSIRAFLEERRIAIL